MGRTREALFSMLEARGVNWPSCRVLDVFAGSGSLALEAVSRGAPFALALEQDASVLRALNYNIRSLELEDRVQVLSGDALRLLRNCPLTPFDVVFLDPPYRQKYVERALPLLSAGWLSERAFLICELEHTLHLKLPCAFTLLAERLFGQTRIMILQLASAKAEEV